MLHPPVVPASPRTPTHHRRRPGAWAALAVATCLGLGSLLTATVPAAVAAGPVAPPLGTAAAYAVLAGQRVTNTGSTTITGNVGVAPGTEVSGNPNVLPPGTIQRGTTPAQQAQDALTNAYTIAAGTQPETPVAVELGGRTLTAGTYTGGELGLTGTLTLRGGPDDVFVFKAASTLITQADSRVQLVGGVQACNIFWQVSSSATLATDTIFVGTIMALTDIDMFARATLEGRALARNGETRLRNNVITRPTCAAAPPPTTAPPTSTGTATPTGPASPTSTSTGPATPTGTATATGTVTPTATATSPGIGGGRNNGPNASSDSTRGGSSGVPVPVGRPDTGEGGAAGAADTGILGVLVARGPQPGE